MNSTDTPRYLDTSLSFRDRAKDLVSRMTLREKAAQMIHRARALPNLHVDEYNWWNEALHGVARAGVATVFPQAIGMAASWNVPLMERVATVISDEARAKHHEALRRGDHGIYKGLTLWSPNINIFRDPRWGRGHETYGECPYLTGRMGVAFIRGLQGDHPTYLKACACAKHYVVHSGPEPERHTFDAEISIKDFRETYLPAFRDCVVDGKVGSVMGAYNRLNGEACCGSKTLIQDILRDEFGFDGYFVSDCGAINDVHANHKLTADAKESAALCVRHGCDLNCGEAYRGVVDAVEAGLLDEADLDKAVVNLMVMRMRLGMFDPPEAVPYSSIPYEINDCDEHHELALQMARESIVLLKNEGGLLPLDREAIKSVAVIGPNADSLDVLIGNYFGTPSRHVSLLQGIQDAVNPGTRVWYAEGCSLFDQPASPWAGTTDRWLAEALAAAERADVVVMCMGLSPRLEGEEGDVANSDGGGDRVRIDLYDCQQQLLKAVHATGKPIVLVLCNGSALAVNWADENIPAIVEAWYPGGEGGTAVADVLFGDCNPAGRLPVTFYRSMDDLPDFREYAMADRTYRYFTGEPLYPFGFGLSYTRFEYSDLKLSVEEIQAGASVDVSVTVVNTGDRVGDEVVQLYVRDLEASVTVPAHELRGLERIKLAPGESRTATFTLAPRDLSLINDAGERVLEPGCFEIFVGGRQPDSRSNALATSNILSTVLTVTGEPLTLPY